MAVKLTAETLVNIDHYDLCAVLTEHLCGDSYGPLSELRVACINPNDAEGGFSLILAPKQKKEAA